MSDKPKSAAARLIAPVRGKIIIACVMQAISTIAGMAPFIAVVEITRALLEGARPEQAVTIAWIAAAALAIKLVCMIAAGSITHFADTDLQLMIRRDVAAKLRRVSLSWFTSRTAGGLKKAMQDDVAALHELVGHAYTSLTGAIAAPVTALLYLAWVNLLLVPVALIPVGIGVALYALQTRGYGEKMDHYETALANVNEAAVEYASGIAVIKTYSGTDRAFSRFVDRTERFVDFFWSWISGLLMVAAITDLVLSPLFAVVLAAGFGLMLTTAGTVTGVEALALQVMAPALTAPFLTLAFGQQGLMQARRAADRLAELLEVRSLDAKEAVQRPTSSEVCFKGVYASYDGARDVLRNINLTLPPGSTTALVGPSGSGKSTLAKLLPRFIDPNRGELTLGGVELSQVAPDHLYDQVGFVFQEVQLLRGSVARNIALGAPDADRATIEAAARAARIHQRILDLPHGYDTIVGEGAALSGGEAQRVTIARALLANRPILVLDEALAFADAETSHALRAALNAWTGTHTLLIVAHDVRSVVAADQICVMDDGRIVACGTHDTLLETNALYARLWAAGSMEDSS